MSKNLSAMSWTRLHRRGPHWDLIKTSPESLKLCQNMLAYAQDERPNMREVLQNAWFEKPPHQLHTVPVAKFEPFLQAVIHQKTKQSLLLQLAASLPFTKSSMILDFFSRIDLDDSGSIDEDEWLSYFQELGIKDAKLIRKVFEILDVDKDGTLYLTEFSAGALLLFKNVLDDRLEALFKRHDTDSNGILDQSEAQQFLEAVSAATDLQGAFTPEAEEFLRHGNVTYPMLREYLLGKDSNSTPSTRKSSRVEAWG